jgi:O-antigen/teichoic acid export membrane protein
MSTARGVIRNSSFLLAINLAARLSSAILFWVVARFRHPEAAGIFTLATSYVLLIEAGTQLGLDQLLIRDIARDPSQAREILQRSLSLRLFSLILMLSGFSVVLTLAHPYTDEVRQTILAMSLIAIPDVFIDMCQALFTVQNRLLRPTIIGIAAAFLRIALGFLEIIIGGPLVYLALVMLVVSILQMGLNLWLTHHDGTQIRLSIAIWRWRSTFRQAIPFGIIQLLLAIESYMGGVILSGSSPIAVLGYYGVANTILSALILIPNAIQLAIFPHMTKLYGISQHMLKIFYIRIYRYLFILAGVFIIGLLVFSKYLIVVLFQEPFAPAAVLLQILSGSLFFYFLNIPNVRVMVILEKQQLMANMLFASVGLSLIMTILLIPYFGILAVPIGRVTSMACFFIMNQFYVHAQLLIIRFRNIFWRLCAALIIGVGLVALTAQSPIWIQLLIGLSGYIGAILVFGELPRAERQYLRSILFSPPSTRDV